MNKREAVLVAVAFAAAAVVLTLPLALDPTHRLPSDLTDTALNAWIIGWDADHLRHGLRGVWDAPIFFPYHDTLAFSETLFGQAILVAPVYWLTADPVLTYNAALLLSFAIAGVGMYLLARELTGNVAAAFAAGMYYAFGPFRLAQIAHIQMVATGWLPIALWGLHRYFSTRRWRWLAVFASAWILQTVSNSYIGYFIAIPVTLVAANGLREARGTRLRTLVPLVVAALVVAVALSPVAAGYYRVRSAYHLTRGVEEIAALGADVRSYLVGKNTIGAWRWLPTAVSTDPERELFPGVFAVALALLGLWTARRDAQLWRWARVYGVIAVAAAALSLGPTVRVWGTTWTTHGPYGWLLAVVPGMTGMRVPARFAIVVVAALSVLVAYGVAWLLRRAPSGSQPLVAAGCVAAVLADGWAVPIPTVRYSARGRAEDRAVSSWLTDRAPGALLHLPVLPSEFQTLHYQWVTLVHRRPIVNGYSGYATPLVNFLASPASPLLDFERFPAGVRMLRTLGVRYVIVHPDDYDAASKAERLDQRTVDALRSSGQIEKEAGLPGTIAFELAPWTLPVGQDAIAPIDPHEMTASASEAPDRLANLFDGNVDTRWIAGIGGQDGSSWLRLQFARPTDVARIELQIAERSINDYPRVLRIDGEDSQGATHTLYHGSPYAELAAGIVRDGRYPPIAVGLPHNATAVVWIRQTAPSRASWSIHELRVWRYDGLRR